MSLAADHHLRMEGMIRYEQLSRYPHAQAEAIAQHYLSHLCIAKQLEKVLSIARYDRSPEVMGVIEYEIALIKTNHIHDLGIALEWPQLMMVSHPQDPNKFTLEKDTK